MMILEHWTIFHAVLMWIMSYKFTDSLAMGVESCILIHREQGISIQYGTILLTLNVKLYSVLRGRPSRFQSLMCSRITLEADSGVSCRPMHSTKSLSGSIEMVSILSWYPTMRTLTHQIEVDTVVDQVVLARLDILGCTEVYPVLLADMLDLLVGASQTTDIRVEFLEVFAQNLRSIADRVASNEHGKEQLVVSSSLLDLVNDLGHLVQLVGADIRAMRETKVNL